MRKQCFMLDDMFTVLNSRWLVTMLLVLKKICTSIAVVVVGILNAAAKAQYGVGYYDAYRILEMTGVLINTKESIG